MQRYESSDVKKLLDIAAFLDPRFKYYKDDEEKKKQIEEVVRIEMLKAVDCDDINTEVDTQDIEEIDGPMPKKSKLGKFLGKNMV